MSNKSDISINPYLTFDSNCSEALKFYKDVLLAEVETMPFSTAPFEVPEEEKNKILHGTVKIGDTVILMASDSMTGQKLVMGNNSHISINAGNIEEATRIFTTLSQDGDVTIPFEDTFWGARFGMVTDQFGVSWMVNCQLS